MTLGWTLEKLNKSSNIGEIKNCEWGQLPLQKLYEKHIQFICELTFRGVIENTLLLSRMHHHFCRNDFCVA